MDVDNHEVTIWDVVYNALSFPSDLPPEEAVTMTTKEQMLQAIRELPDEATVEDAMERLYLLYKVERGIAQANAGQKVSQEEARTRMARWLT
jgi:hypothetical protein